MRAVEITKPGGPDSLSLCDRPIPECGDQDVLINVLAAGVNRPDIVQRKGLYPPPPGASDIPGLEVAGTIVGVGPAVNDYQVGDVVCALVTGGGYAEYTIAHQDLCLPVPGGLSAAEAACLPETFFTVWHNLFQRARLERGETLLIHGGSSGIGTTAIQIAKALGIEVIITAGNETKCSRCLELGADYAINYHDQDFVAVLKEYTEGKGVDVILDMVGGNYIERNLHALAIEGRLVSIAFMTGAKAQVDFSLLLRKRLTYFASTLRPQSVENKARIAAELQINIWPLIERGVIRPIVDSRFPMGEASAAHGRMESGKHIGKIVLEN